jgi:hypothetical protein
MDTDGVAGALGGPIQGSTQKNGDSGFSLHVSTAVPAAGGLAVADVEREFVAVVRSLTTTAEPARSR